MEDNNKSLRRKERDRTRARNYRRRTREVRRALQELSADDLNISAESDNDGGQSLSTVAADSSSESISSEPNVSPAGSSEGREEDNNIEDEHDREVGEHEEDEEFDEDEQCEEPEQYEEERNEIDELRQWALECNISHCHVDKLLGILRRRLLPELPKSSKTFFQTRSGHYEIKLMEDSDGGLAEYVYLGIERGILQCVNEELHPDQKITLQVNVDGLPLFKSSNKQFWPILCKIFCNPDVYKPFVAAVYSGNAKPKNASDYFENFIEEINRLNVDGINIAGRQFDIRIQCFICDTPARAFIKCTKGHGGYSACERCTVRGVRCDNRTVYPETNCSRRSDRTFRNLTDPEHHTDISPITMIEPPLNMVSSVILDSMHLYALVMKKLLTEMWLGGHLRVRLSRRYRAEMSRRLECLKVHTPCEFQRKPRSANLVMKWKATEFRFFLLYCGPIVLRNLLSKNLYDHFLLLHTACRILSSDELCLMYSDYAEIYLRRFFEALPRLYGQRSQILSMHNLIHLADDVRNMRCSLSRLSAFPFENLLGKLKELIRTPNHPLAQLCRRLHEITALPGNKVTIPSDVTILKAKSVDNNSKILISKLSFESATLTTSVPNNVVMLDNGTILLIKEMFAPMAAPGNVKIKGRLWGVRKSLFVYPTDSKHLRMFELLNEPSARTVQCYIQQVECKMVKLELPLQLNRRRITYAMPLLHH